MKVVINADFGGFGLSNEAIYMYAELKGIKLYEEKEGSFTHFYRDVEKKDYFFENDIPRDDESLVKVVETLGAKANGNYSSLKVIEIPDGVNWFVEEYDGREWVAERHRTWD